MTQCADAYKAVLERISSTEAEKLHPEQWVNVYGISEGRIDYLNTCQVSQLDTVLNNIPAHWWESFLLEAIADDGDLPT